MMQPTLLGQGGGVYNATTSQAPSQVSRPSLGRFATTPSTSTERYTRIDGISNTRVTANDRGDSWVEVSSQPSDSYTSSSSSTENIAITEGLHLRSQKRRRKTRQQQMNIAAGVAVTDSQHVDTSSDEREGDNLSDAHLGSIGSSMADLPSLSEGCDEEPESASESSEDMEEEDEEIGTEVNMNTNETSSQPTRPFTAFASSSTRPQVPRGPSFSRAPPQPDHDAALRASLSTLLSCAAATRGLPKPRQDITNRSSAYTGGRVQMQSLSLMTNEQREAMMEFVAATPAQNNQQSTTSCSPPTTQPVTSHQQSQSQIPGKARRKSSTTTNLTAVAKDSRSRSKSTSAQRRSHRASKSVASSLPIAPANYTYITIAVSAATVLVVSAISFSAGYALGKEVGRNELLSLTTDGQDLVRRAASETMGRAGGRMVMGGHLRSIAVR